MAKIKKIVNENDGVKYHMDQYAYWCKGCGHIHVFSLKVDGGHHKFNMDMDNPTVEPSLLQNFGGGSKICHSFIRGGHIQYLNDCQHELAGQTIVLPEIEDHLV